MVTIVHCGALAGVDAYQVTLEVAIARSGIPGFTMVGLAETSVRESRDRVFAALRSCNIKIPPARITVNLAPADRKKAGTAYDLPLAIGLMAASGILPPTSPQGYFFAGELSLSGEVRPTTGILPMAILARKNGAKGFITSEDNAAEAAIVEGLPVYAVRSLGEAAAFLKEPTTFSCIEPTNTPTPLSNQSTLDFVDVKGQEHAKRAIEIAAAGGHNILFLGPPGSGKTMLAKRVSTVLPALEFEESLDVTKIYSITGMLPSSQGLIKTRPFRSPHHSISEFGLIGGGAYPKPGEISLAHRGVLFLDELLEFKKQTLENLRQPIEDGKVTIARASQTLCYPAEFMLVAAMNPCPCGYATHPSKKCTCTAQEIHRYRARLSGPLLDRIDLHIEVPAVNYQDLQNTVPGKNSADMRKNVEAARNIQRQRYAGKASRTNASLEGKALETHCQLDAESGAFLSNAMHSLHLSARAYTKILRVARTIADLDGAERLCLPHLAEAINCRALDRMN